RKIFWPRGKVLGGSSSINGMVYIRGQAEDFDLWRQLGCTGWSFQDVLPLFKRAEHQTRGADDFHSTGGPLCVSDVDQHPLCYASRDAAVARGATRNDASTPPEQGAVRPPTPTTGSGTPCSPPVVYPKRVMNRPTPQPTTHALPENTVATTGRATAGAFRRH